MKLNDPFGRMERRHQAGYEAMRQSLLRGGINSSESARDLIHQSKKRALKTFGVAFLIFLVILVAWPKAMTVALFLLLFLAVWLVNSTVNGQRYIERFIEEEMK